MLQIAGNERARKFIQTVVEVDMFGCFKVIRGHNYTVLVPVNRYLVQYNISIDVLRRFAKHKVKAEKKYSDVLFDVTGTVVGVKRDANGRFMLNLLNYQKVVRVI